MTISAALANLSDRLNAAVEDIKATVSSKQTLAADNSDLLSRLAVAEKAAEDSRFAVSDLTAKLAAADAAKADVESKLAAAEAEISALKAAGKSAAAEAAGIVASLGVPPVAAVAGSNEPQASLGEKLASITNPRERAEFLKANGGAAAVFAKIRKETPRK